MYQDRLVKMCHTDRAASVLGYEFKTRLRKASVTIRWFVVQFQTCGWRSCGREFGEGTSDPSAAAEARISRVARVCARARHGEPPGGKNSVTRTLRIELTQLTGDRVKASQFSVSSVTSRCEKRENARE